MQVDVGMALQPPVIFGLVRVQVVQHDVKFAIRVGGHDLIHEVQKLSPPPAVVVARNDLSGGDVEGGLRAAASVGDDTLEKRSQGYAVPDSFTHGTSAQRVHWFERGLAKGDVEACDTFSAGRL